MSGLFFLTNPVHDLPITDQDAMTADTLAPVQLVIFSDFAMISRQWEEQYGGKINLVFKHYPLSTSCNPEMEYDMHPNACMAARAAQAALQQGKFWSFHDLLFEQEFTTEDLPVLAANAGIELEQFLKDTNDPNIEEKVNRDINLANELKIMGTPAIFLNGRQVENPYPEKIEAFIEQTLAPEV